MKTPISLPLAALALWVSSLACVTVLGEEPAYPAFPSDKLTFEQTPKEPAPAPPQTRQICPTVTEQIIELAVYYDENFEEHLLDEELTLVVYAVEGDDIFDPQYNEVPLEFREAQKDAYAHQRVWEHFTALIPAAQRKMLAEYGITTDGYSGTLASVAQTEFDPNSWALYIDFADTSNAYELTYTLIHEFAHLLTLGPDQVTPSLAIFNNPDDDEVYFNEISACPYYFPGEGCARLHSYIHNFFQAFWTDIHEEWNEINLEEDEDLYNEKLDDFYDKYKDRFVTSYAVTNPEEDIAETFTFFILSPKPAGNTAAEKKILFFYQYPELVELREMILNNVCLYFAN